MATTDLRFIDGGRRCHVEKRMKNPVTLMLIAHWLADAVLYFTCIGLVFGECSSHVCKMHS